MRTWLVAALAATSLGLLAAPAALADAGPAVNGIGRVTIDTGAKSDAIRVAYRTAVGAAIDDAKDEAAFLAARAGLKVGAITSLVEQSSPPLDGCAVYAYDRAVSSPSSSKPKSTTITKPKAKHKRKKHAVKKASAIAEPVLLPEPFRLDGDAHVRSHPRRCALSA